MSKKISNDIWLRAIKTFFQTLVAMLMVTPVVVNGRFDTQALYSVIVATFAACLSGGQNYLSATIAERKRPSE